MDFFLDGKNLLLNEKLKNSKNHIDLVKENLPENLEEFIKLGLVKDEIYKKNEASIQDVLNICSTI